MGDAIAAFGDLIVAHRAWAAPLFGLIAFGESVAGIGIIIPATPILFLMGTLIGAGKLAVAPVLAWAIPGAVAGYWLSWAAGMRSGSRIYRGRALRRHRRGVARARLFFRAWGGPALIAGRYILGPFQSMLPLVAGVARMDARRFHLWNTASGVIWVVVCLAPGYLAARGLWSLGDGSHVQLLVAVSAALSIAAILVAALSVLWRRPPRMR